MLVGQTLGNVGRVAVHLTDAEALGKGAVFGHAPVHALGRAVGVLMDVVLAVRPGPVGRDRADADNVADFEVFDHGADLYEPGHDLMAEDQSGRQTGVHLMRVRGAGRPGDGFGNGVHGLADGLRSAGDLAECIGSNDSITVHFIVLLCCFSWLRKQACSVS